MYNISLIRIVTMNSSPVLWIYPNKKFVIKKLKGKWNITPIYDTTAILSTVFFITYLAISWKVSYFQVFLGALDLSLII
jgi:hypothetical protein